TMGGSVLVLFMLFAGAGESCGLGFPAWRRQRFRRQRVFIRLADMLAVRAYFNAVQVAGDVAFANGLGVRFRCGPEFYRDAAAFGADIRYAGEYGRGQLRPEFPQPGRELVGVAGREMDVVTADCGLAELADECA